MTTLSTAKAHAFAAEWIAAWNAHDLERVLAHYTDDMELASPLIVSIAGEPSGKLHGKAAVRAYWTKALALVPDLHFETLDVLAGAGTLTIYYQGHRGTVAETFHLDEAHKVRAAESCYSVGR